MSNLKVIELRDKVPFGWSCYLSIDNSCEFACGGSKYNNSSLWFCEYLHSSILTLHKGGYIKNYSYSIDGHKKKRIEILAYPIKKCGINV